MEKIGEMGNRQEKQNYTEKLRHMLGRVANEINYEAAEHGLGNLVNPDCTISMQDFLQTGESGGGIYKQSEIDRDLEDARRMEIGFSGANDPGVQKFFNEQKGINTAEGIVKDWKASKEKSKSGQTEMVITALLHKMLRKDFLIVRSAVIDDYKSGMDNLILDKQTGEAICAFDEVHEGGEGEQTDKKKEKIKKIVMKGGVGAKYGIGLEGGKLKRTKMDKVPVFYLRLKSEDLLKLMAEMHDDLGEQSPIEQSVFADLVKSLREQKEMLSTLNLPPVIKEKLGNFENTLQKLENILP